MSSFEGRAHQPHLHNYGTGRTYPESAYPYAAPIYSSQSSTAVSTTAPIYHNATQVTPSLSYSLSQIRASFENSPDPYLNVGSTPVPNVTSYSPQKGGVDTKLYVNVTTLYELATANLPTFYLIFGHRKCQASLQKMGQQSTCSYTVTCDVPPFSSTSHPNSTVPIYLSMESGDGDSTDQVDVGHFLYLDAGNQSSHGTPQDNPRKRKVSSASSELMKSPLKRSQSQQLRPKEEYGAYPYSLSDSLPSYSTTYIHPSAPYHTSSLVPPYGRATAGYQAQVAPRHVYGYSGSASSPAIKSAQPPHVGSNWNSGYAHVSSNMSRSPGITTNGDMSRPSLSALPSPGAQGNPKLVRTSTIVQTRSPATTPHGQVFNSYTQYPTKAKLDLHGDIEAMGDHCQWSQEEVFLRRRLVHFRRSQSGSTVSASCSAVLQDKRAQQSVDSVFISCIYWAERQECFVTSVDTIYLLELLLGYRFGVEEKNRIRRNLEGFRPVTVSKGKPESEEFFKVIMAFPVPKPRNIEKDVKVFQWRDLEPALKKIIGKFSASPSSVIGPFLPKSEISNGYAVESSSAAVSFPNDHYHGPPSPRSTPGSTRSAVYHNLPAKFYSPHDQRAASQQGPLGLRSSSSNLHESAGQWPNSPTHMHNAQQYLSSTSHRNSWDPPSYPDYNQASAGSSTPTQSYSYSTPRTAAGPAAPGSDNRIEREMPEQSQQVPRS